MVLVIMYYLFLIQKTNYRQEETIYDKQTNCLDIVAYTAIVPRDPGLQRLCRGCAARC